MKQAIPLNENGFVPHPHIMLLGAGASVAACPNGDRLGRTIPVLRDLPVVLGIEARLAAAGFATPILDFEEVFTQIVADQDLMGLRLEIEDRVFGYFSELELPDEPTVYDFLVTGLRKKDLIATFNWDPFLIKAMIRNQAFVTGPQTVFLHGNVLVGHCMKDRVVGFPGRPCGTCGQTLQRSKLLYPVGKKNYAEDEFIASQWEILRKALAFGYGFTIFGYSGPKTDAEARSLMANEWTSSPIYRQSEVEIIDIEERDILERRWKDITFSHHYRIAHRFQDSMVFRHPRRSTEALFDALLMCQPRRDTPFPEVTSVDEIKAFLTPFIAQEKEGVRQVGE